MSRLPALLLCLVPAACATDGMWREVPVAHNAPVLPAEDSEVMRRITGRAPGVAPLLPEPGDIWADVLPRDVSPSPDAEPPAPMRQAAQRPPVPQRPPAAAPAVALFAAGASHPPLPGSPQRTVDTRPLVQLTAAGSARQAEAAWDRLQRRAPGLVGDRRPIVVAAQLQGRAVWRLRTGGFADLADARAFCASLRAARSDCWVVPE